MIYGHSVTKLREELSRTRQDLADILGVSPVTIAKSENSKSRLSSTNLTLSGNIAPYDNGLSSRSDR